MKRFIIEDIPGFDQWRTAAREALLAHIPPDRILWNDAQPNQDDLFGASVFILPTKHVGEIIVSKQFMDSAQTVCCHADASKFALLYRILWRITFENKNLLQIATDDDILTFNGMIKAVRRDAYKITAFLRFREIQHEGKPHFVAWYEPEHYTLERVTPFFQTRFRNMDWSILTPYRAAHWKNSQLLFEDNPNPGLYPKDDQVEGYWLTYYANIFNPARPKKAAMLNQMPKKYWKNMPETALVPTLLRTANARTQDMIHKSQSGE